MLPRSAVDTDAEPARLPADTSAEADTFHIPGYEILGELGRGGMGVVYKARQVKLQRLVALKMVLAGVHAGPAELARFRAEAEAIARLQHPNIVQVHEIGEWRENDSRPPVPYFSLEYCTGGTLAQRINGTPWPAIEAARMIETLARAMDVAHQNGIVHRDLKPANILLQMEESRSKIDNRPPQSAIANLQSAIPKISDFGMAKKLGEAGQTVTGTIMGTPSYMAPEQAVGQGKDVSPAADVYALGAILYELLTGRPPFRAPSPVDTILQVVSDEPVTPTQLQSRTPRDLETICLKCLNKDPLKRYDSALSLAEDLRRFQADRPILARPAGLIERAVKWVRRHPGVAASLLVVALVSAAGIAAFAWAFERVLEARNVAQRETQEKINEQSRTAAALKDTELARDKADDNLKLADINLKLAEKETRQKIKELLRADCLLYAGHIAEAQGHWQNRDLVRCRLALDESRWDLRGPEYVYLAQQLERLAPIILGHPDGISSLIASGDGQRLFVGGGPSIKVWDLKAGTEIRRLGGKPQDRTLSLAANHDGTRLFAGGDDGKIRVWDIDSGKAIRTIPAHSGWIRCLIISADGKYLFSGSDDGSIKIWDLAKDTAPMTLSGVGRVYSLALSGKRLFAGVEDGIRSWRETPSSRPGRLKCCADIPVESAV